MTYSFYRVSKSKDLGRYIGVSFTRSDTDSLVEMRKAVSQYKISLITFGRDIAHFRASVYLDLLQLMWMLIGLECRFLQRV